MHSGQLAAEVGGHEVSLGLVCDLQVSNYRLEGWNFVVGAAASPLLGVKLIAGERSTNCRFLHRLHVSHITISHKTMSSIDLLDIQYETEVYLGRDTWGGGGLGTSGRAYQSRV